MAPTNVTTNPRLEQTAPRPKRGILRLVNRLVFSAIALAALAVMVNGARWELTDAPAAANELVMARSVIDVISGDTVPPNDARAPARITTKDAR